MSVSFALEFLKNVTCLLHKIFQILHTGRYFRLLSVSFVLLSALWYWIWYTRQSLPFIMCKHTSWKLVYLASSYIWNLHLAFGCFQVKFFTSRQPRYDADISRDTENSGKQAGSSKILHIYIMTAEPLNLAQQIFLHADMNCKYPHCRTGS